MSLAILEPAEAEIPQGNPNRSRGDSIWAKAIPGRLRKGAPEVIKVGTAQARWKDTDDGPIAARISMIIRALGLRKRGSGYARVFGRCRTNVNRYRRRECRPKTAFIVRLHRLEEIYAEEIARMRQAEIVYGGFKKIPAEVLDTLWRLANKGIGENRAAVARGLVPRDRNRNPQADSMDIA